MSSLHLSVVRLSVVTRVYCDKITEDRSMLFSLQSSQSSQLLAWYKCENEITKCPLIEGLNYVGEAYDFAKL